MTDRNAFLISNIKNIQSWAHSSSQYRPQKPTWVYEIGGIHPNPKAAGRESWQIEVCSTEFDITEQEDRLSGISARPTIKPRPSNIEIQPIELEFFEAATTEDGPFEMIPINNDVFFEPIDTFIPIPVIRIVCNQAEQSFVISNYNSFMEQTPKPIRPSVPIFSALRPHGTPEGLWTVARGNYDSSRFASPQLEPFLEEVAEIVRPPKLPKK